MMKDFLAKKLSMSVAILVALFALEVGAEIPINARNAQVVILGEQHDNPSHHKRQAAWVEVLKPTAIVFEMLSTAQAERAQRGWKDQSDLEGILEWSSGGWPLFDMYYPIFAASPDAKIIGAGVSREDMKALFGEPLKANFLAQEYGEDAPLSPREQAARADLQSRAHCGAMPEEMLPKMIDLQRYRDIFLVDGIMRGLASGIGPVVVITGNGHARSDWGVPKILSRLAPDVSVFSLGQGEDGIDPDGTFNLRLDAVAPERGDPCAAFNQ